MTAEQLKWLNSLKSFESIDDIPIFDGFEKDDYINYVIPKIIELGGIPKKDLIANKWYIGINNDTQQAKWTGESLLFKRFRWGFNYLGITPHFEDNYNGDGFIPIKIKELDYEE